MDENRLCPPANAAESLGERRAILILREFLWAGGGATRCNALQNALGDISPALRTKRVKQLEPPNMLIRRKIPDQKSHELDPTDAREALLPVLTRTASAWRRPGLFANAPRGPAQA